MPGMHAQSAWRKAEQACAQQLVLRAAPYHTLCPLQNEQRMRHASATFLLSNDRALLLKAQASVCICFVWCGIGRTVWAGGHAAGRLGGVPNQA